MEEILASIRQIISEDGEGSKTSASENAPRQGSPPPAPAKAAPEEPPYETVVSSFEAQPVPPAAPPPHPEPTRPQPEAAKYWPERAADPQPRTALARRPQPPEDEEPLLSPEKGEAVSGAFGALAHTILAQNSRTLEDVVGQMLQPMLKSWLDDNLPSLVERMVKEEIERVSRGRR
jgi:cell pole-organizing protein PopZ